MSFPIKTTTPQYPITVPSTGKKVVFRPFLVGEQKSMSLALATEDNDTIITAIKQLIFSCSHGVLDVSVLSAFDVEYLFLQLRAKSVGESVQLVAKCTNEDCDASLEFDVDVSKLEVDRSSSPESDKVQLSETIGCQLRYPSMEETTKLREQFTEQLLVDVTTDCIVAVWNQEEFVQTKDYTRNDLVQFVDTLTVEQLKLLTDWIITAPYVHHEVDLVCPQCKTKTTVVLRGLENFFA